MAHKPPPVPPAEQSPKGVQRSKGGQQKTKAASVPDNQSEQDRHGNIYQNTHNQGYQQDR